MAFIYVLIILFVLLLIYQYYSFNTIEGIDQAEIDKINSKLTELVSQVHNITDGTFMKQLKSDVDTSKGNIGTLNSEFQFYKDNKDNINEMILASSELLNAKNDAMESVEFDDGQDDEEPMPAEDEVEQEPVPTKTNSKPSPGKKIKNAFKPKEKKIKIQ